MPETATPPAFLPALLDDNALAHYLSMSRRGVWRLTAEKRLPEPVTVPGMKSRRWRREEIDRAVAQWTKG